MKKAGTVAQWVCYKLTNFIPQMSQKQTLRSFRVFIDQPVDCPAPLLVEGSSPDRLLLWAFKLTLAWKSIQSAKLGLVRCDEGRTVRNACRLKAGRSFL